MVVEKKPPSDLCLSCTFGGHHPHTCKKGPDVDDKLLIRIRRDDNGKLVYLAVDNETISDIARKIKLDRDVLLKFNKRFIHSIRMDSKLFQDTHVRVPDIPRYTQLRKKQRQTSKTLPNDTATITNSDKETLSVLSDRRQPRRFDRDEDGQLVVLARASELERGGDCLSYIAEDFGLGSSKLAQYNMQYPPL